jgi:uncharacterized protein YegJ (DUF2314 family)
MLKLCTIILLLMLSSCNANKDADKASAAEGVDENGVVLIAADDPEMNAAIAKAQATLDEFLATNAAPPAGTDGYKLKVKLTDKNGSEHFWVEPFKQTKDGFEGTLANEPEMVTGYKLGQKITFPRKDISDWGYVKDGHQIGSFTVCAAFKEMSADEVKYYRTEYGFDC